MLLDFFGSLQQQMLQKTNEPKQKALEIISLDTGKFTDMV